jgi:hypothetical protein
VWSSTRYYQLCLSLLPAYLGHAVFVDLGPVLQFSLLA